MSKVSDKHLLPKPGEEKEKFQSRHLELQSGTSYQKASPPNQPAGGQGGVYAAALREQLDSADAENEKLRKQLRELERELTDAKVGYQAVHAVLAQKFGMPVSEIAAQVQNWRQHLAPQPVAETYKHLAPKPGTVEGKPAPFLGQKPVGDDGSK